MKKIYFAIAACAMFAFTACNNSTETKGEDTAKKDSVAAPAAEPAAPAANDSNANMKDSGKAEAGKKDEAKGEKK